jgi:hypothetical protein
MRSKICSATLTIKDDHVRYADIWILGVFANYDPQENQPCALFYKLQYKSGKKYAQNTRNTLCA